MRRAIYGLLAAVILANLHLQNKLKPDEYYKVPRSPGLWKHVKLPVEFTLTVDYLGVKYFEKGNTEHLIESITNAGYELSIEWGG